ncbi:DKNYY domain-containing protein [Reichenbachiella agarivorans]|uniref:DKNYY domain-containing protein n=1 Tax=Reichenbachiella agarivorans TaxID=2979464 RepID=A0ABY6CL60_9BACT|nr:DKNYY domain-containing protein [Reichenbachiella agarivorans]UXP30820.1 DKNYY domain-containing protein [Reichenbachiella agarivorans]
MILLLNAMVHKVSQKEHSPLAYLFLAVLSLIAQACSPFSGVVNEELSGNYYYNKRKSDIQYSPMGNWFELGNTKMNADVASFEVLERDFARDKNHVYFKEHAIDSELDAATIEIRDYTIFDQYHVYIPVDYMPYDLSEQIMTDKQLYVIEGADPKSYQELDRDWARDAQNWFYNYRIIAVDYDSFEIVNDNFCKDKDKVYLRKNDILLPSDIDAASCKKLDARYVVDKDFIYDFQEWKDGEQVDRLRRFSYRSLDNCRIDREDYLIFDDQVIYDGEPIKGVDQSTFFVMKGDWNSYAKDANRVYFCGKVIEGADPASFVLYKYNLYAHDKDFVYHRGEKMPMADVATFGPADKDGFIYRDKNHRYVGGEIRED